MKKFIKFFVVILSVFILTGCVSETDRNDLLDYMDKEKFIY
jgi:predicted small lipoprotein YifL